jgi:uncharacterized protein YcfJ
MKYLLTCAFLLSVVSPWSQAHHDRGYYKAKVVNTMPVYKYRTVKRPQEICHVYDGHRNHINNGRALIGGVIGGTIGHAVSNRKHKVLGTIAGTIIGSSIAHQPRNSAGTYGVSHRNTSQLCRVNYHTAEKVRVLSGFNVTYKLKGRLYQTFTKNRPGKRIRIYY